MHLMDTNKTRNTILRKKATIWIQIFPKMIPKLSHTHAQTGGRTDRQTYSHEHNGNGNSIIIIIIAIDMENVFDTFNSNISRKKKRRSNTEKKNEK